MHTKKAYQLFTAKPADYMLEIMSGYYLLLKNLKQLLQNSPQKKLPIFDERVKKIMLFIQVHYGERITLTDLAKQLSLSNAETIRLFKHFTGKTPFQYLTAFRLEQSIHQLHKKNYTVTEIGALCGFLTTSYFIQRFKESYQLTPKQYQKQIEKAE